jgi:predicted exporter
VSLVFGSVHGITLGFGTTLIGEAVDYAIYFLIQARAGGWRAWLAGGWPTVRLGLLTSICGFAALMFSGFPGLSQLGVFSVAGLMGAVLATRFVLPVLMPDGVGQDKGLGVRARLGAFAGWAVRGLPRWRWPLLALSVAAAALLLVRGDLWRAELGSLSPISKEALDLDASLRADLSAGDARSLVVVQAADLQATLRQSEAVARALEPLAERGALAGVDSVARWLPSLAMQEARKAALPDAATLAAALQQATQGGPLKAERLAPFIQEVQAARSLAPITRESFTGTALAPLIDALLLRRADGSWVALMPLQPVDDKLDSAAIRLALKGLDGVQTLEIGAELTRLYARYLGEAQTQALLGALGVVLLIGFTLRSLPRLLRVCQPLLLSVLLTMGALAAFGVHLGILHLVGLLLVVAVGSNYALFFDMLQHEARVHGKTAIDSDTLASLLLANLTTVLSFGLIALSAIPALASIGRVVAPGALLALLLSAAFAPGLTGASALAPRARAAAPPRAL